MVEQQLHVSCVGRTHTCGLYVMGHTCHMINVYIGHGRKQVAKVRSWYVNLGELAMERERERERVTFQLYSEATTAYHSVIMVVSTPVSSC